MNGDNLKTIPAVLAALILFSCINSATIETPESYLFYREEMTATSNVFCWKDAQGEYRCGVLASHYGVTPSDRLLSFMHDLLPCPLKDMKELIDAHYDSFSDYISPNRQNTIYEVSKTVGKDGKREWSVLESKQRDLYVSLGLEDVFDKHYPGVFIESQDFTKINDYKDYSKAVTNDSLILCWKGNNGEWLCGSPFLSKFARQIKYETVRWMQEVMPLKLEGMAAFLNDFRNIQSGYKTFKYADNAVIEIPANVSEKEWESLSIDPRDEASYSKNIDLYRSLGLEDLYLGKREPIEFGPVGNEKFPSLDIDKEEIKAFYKKEIERCRSLYFWRKNESYFVLPRSGVASIGGLAEFVAFAQEEMPCPLECFKELLPANHNKINVYEIDYPFLFSSGRSLCEDEDILRTFGL